MSTTIWLLEKNPFMARGISYRGAYVDTVLKAYTVEKVFSTLDKALLWGTEITWELYTREGEIEITGNHGEFRVRKFGYVDDEKIKS